MIGAAAAVRVRHGGRGFSPLQFCLLTANCIACRSLRSLGSLSKILRGLQTLVAQFCVVGEHSAAWAAKARAGPVICAPGSLGSLSGQPILQPPASGRAWGPPFEKFSRSWKGLPPPILGRKVRGAGGRGGPPRASWGPPGAAWERPASTVGSWAGLRLARSWAL